MKQSSMFPERHWLREEFCCTAVIDSRIRLYLERKYERAVSINSKYDYESWETMYLRKEAQDHRIDLSYYDQDIVWAVTRQLRRHEQYV